MHLYICIYVYLSREADVRNGRECERPTQARESDVRDVLCGVPASRQPAVEAGRPEGGGEHHERRAQTQQPGGEGTLLVDRGLRLVIRL